jgi:hypothetical protein
MDEKVFSLEGLDHSMRRRESETSALRNLGQAKSGVFVPPTEQDAKHAVDGLGAVLFAPSAWFGSDTVYVSHLACDPSLGHTNDSWGPTCSGWEIRGKAVIVPLCSIGSRK